MLRTLALLSSLLAALVGLCACAAHAPSKTPVADDSAAQKPISASKIILAGDSTTAVQGGWGPAFCAEHVTSFVACVNLARGGRSSGSYIAEGSWTLALAEARTPGYANTWVLIQFGHNDQPGKPGRSTDLATEFPANLERYVREARAAHAIPILVTPLTRRMFKDGTLQNDLLPWAEAAKRVAVQLRVPLIDLNAMSSAAVQAMGSSEANAFAQRRPTKEVAAAAALGTTIPAATVNEEPPPSETVPGMAVPKLAFDYTHLGHKGSEYFAAMVAGELARQVPGMRPLLIP